MHDPASYWAHYLVPVAVAVAAPLAQANDFLTIPQAQQALFPAARTFAERPLALSDDQRSAIANAAGVRQRWDVQKIWRAEKDGQLLGWFVVDDVVGKHEFITYAAALSPDGRVLGIEVLSYRETHGGQIREAEWRKHFVGKKLGDTFKLDEDVPNISGATLSCRNVLDGVKRLLVIQKLYLPNA
ncbi:FMN-binding protein [Azoarcus olearius]|uniref:FMN-binding domain-containing protein n=1 Tax=Azoarcus sp. (strain BH72) TaxID=418699 RepID=A1K845_AZOSB|nr:FMN-binding protein [Azoarcus olearius]ANQ85539.1 hypothetical protein dqs_2509 [Azoarcus olearius]CAL95000.1 conserved hypothetical protein [Azoarcus olearius]